MIVIVCACTPLREYTCALFVCRHLLRLWDMHKAGTWCAILTSTCSHVLPHAATFNQVEYLPSHDWSRCHGMLKQVQAFLAGVNEVDIVLERPHLPGHAVPGAGGAGGGGGGGGEEDEAFSSRHTALQHVNLVRRLLNLQ